MKRFSYISYSVLLAAACVAVSCNDKILDTEGMNSSQLGFSPIVGNLASKAIIDGNTFPEDGEFNVNAVFYGDKDIDGNTDYSKPQNFFFNATAAKNAKGTWSLKNGDRYYWPLSGEMYFIGFYPINQVLLDMHLYTGITMNPNYTGVFHNYTIKHSTGTPDYTVIDNDNAKTESNLYAGKVDFMFADNRFPDVNARTSDVVPLTFGHNLTQIQFKVKAAQDYSTCDYRKADNTAGTASDWDHVNVNHVKMRIEKISLENIWSRGEYYTNAPHWKDEDLKDLYNYVLLDREGTDASHGTELLYDCGDGEDPRDECEDYTYFSTRTPYAVPVTSTSENTPIATLMIPQRLHSSAVINITYTLRQENKREYNNGSLEETDPAYRSTYLLNDYSGTVTKTLKLADITPVWAIATKYIYTIVVGLNEIKLNAEYVNWNTGTTEDVVL